MLLTELKPLQKFISTDILGQPALNKYSTGYIAHVAPVPRSALPFLLVTTVITRVGKTGKSRIMVKEFYIAPVIYTKLISKMYYNGATHILTKNECVNVLKMDNFEFMVWTYTNLIAAEKLRINSLWPDAFDPLTLKLRKLAKYYPDYPNQQIEEVVGSTMVREIFLERLRVMHSFLRQQARLDHTTNTIRMLEAHYKMAEMAENVQLGEELLEQIKILKSGKKLPEEILTENKNVSTEYENSGYWV